MKENDESRKAMFAEIYKQNAIRTESRKKGKGWFEEKDARTGKAPKHQKAASKKNSLPISNARII